MRFEAFCLNQCSGHGRCDDHGGYCHCEPGYSGVDCSMSVAAAPPDAGAPAVALHEQHAARRGARRPSIYVYELPEHTSLILQLMAPGAMCSHRGFDAANQTVWSRNNNYAYSVDVLLHEVRPSAAPEPRPPVAP